MAVSTFDSDVFRVRLPINKASAPVVYTSFVSDLLGRVYMVNFKNAHVVGSTYGAFAAETFNDSEFAPPVGNSLVGLESVRIPILFLAGRRTEPCLAWLSALLTLTGTPSSSEVAGMRTVFPAFRAHCVKRFLTRRTRTLASVLWACWCSLQAFVPRRMTVLLHGVSIYAAIARRRIADAAPLFVKPVEVRPEPKLFGEEGA